MPAARYEVEAMTPSAAESTPSTLAAPVASFGRLPATCLVRSVRHVQQKHNWDCGVTCVLMAVDEASRGAAQADLKRVCQEAGFGRSTWSIDLCYLLVQLAPGLPVRYTTVTLGVDPGYATQAFYSGVINKDASRVQERFDRASSQAGLSVEKRSVTVADLVEHVAFKVKMGSIGWHQTKLSCFIRPLTSTFRQLADPSWTERAVTNRVHARNAIKIIY